MYKKLFILALSAMVCYGKASAQTMIQKNEIKLQSDYMTPEALWAMGRIGQLQASPDGRKVVYQVSYYSVKQNASHTILYVMDANGKNKVQLTTDAKSESDASWIEGGHRIAYLRGGELWSMSPDGTDRKQLSHTDGAIEGYKYCLLYTSDAADEL